MYVCMEIDMCGKLMLEQAQPVIGFIGWISFMRSTLKSLKLVLNVCSFTFQTDGDAVVGKELKATIVFQNPLQRTLKNVKFRFEGLGLQSVREVSYG